MIELLTLILFGLATMGFATLAIWQARRSLGSSQQKALCAALALTAVWTGTRLTPGLNISYSVIAEAVRNLGWLGFMWTLAVHGHERRAGYVYAAIGFTLLATIATSALQLSSAAAITLLQMVAAVGSLVLVNSLYLEVAPRERNRLTLPVMGLGVMWATDLNVHGVAYFAAELPSEMRLLRAGVFAALTIIFALAMVQAREWRFSLSRQIAFRSASLLLIGGYVAAAMMVTGALAMIGGDIARTMQIAFVLGTAVVGLLLFPSQSFRAWLKVKIAKHFFAHRYDYREEWMRFSQTMGNVAGDGPSFEVRVIKALADIADSPGGALLVPDGAGSLIEKARWNWNGADIPHNAGTPAFVSAIKDTGHILDLSGDGPVTPPYWMGQEKDLWVALPLLHFSELAGVVLLEKPLTDRALDWEDLDMFRVAGRQAASYLAEEAGRSALTDARRFDEFNRRFAFMMHDIKNVVSQLSLVARNAEKHADNPEFRADMVATIKGSSDKMSAMLARLSQHGSVPGEPVRPVVVLDIIDTLARDFRARHPVVIMRDAEPVVLADPHRLEQALTHLVQNAADASEPNEPVTVAVRAGDGRVMIDIIDRGTGMSPAFIANELFRPFVSVKAGGFGIGAYEARELVRSMGGELAVQSAEGVGTHFTITLPLALDGAAGKQTA